MFIGTKNLLVNRNNIETARVEADGHIEITMVSGRTFHFTEKRLVRKLMRPRRSRLVRLICWIFGV